MRGFTLVELLITIAIGLLLSAMGLAVYGNLHSDAVVFDTAKQLVQTLRLAKEQNSSGLHGARHGVYVFSNPATQDNAVIYTGNSYALRDTVYDRTIYFAESAGISFQGFTVVNNAVDINFSGSGSVPSNSGRFLISQAGSDTLSVTVSSTGFINW